MKYFVGFFVLLYITLTGVLLLLFTDTHTKLTPFSQPNPSNVSGVADANIGHREDTGLSLNLSFWWDMLGNKLLPNSDTDVDMEIHPQRNCPDVLNMMPKGQWIQREMTEQERLEMKAFYMDTRRQRGLPLTLQRQDGRCGNISLPEDHSWRAQCHPDGPTPCCHGSVCVNRTRAECACPDCHDMRSLVYAEYATWVPAEASCRPTKMSAAEICKLLDGATVHFVGDSSVRQLYAAFLMTVRGDEQYGALSPLADEIVKRQCAEKYIFPANTACSRWLDTSVKLCHDKAAVSFKPHGYPARRKVMKHIQDIAELQRAAKTLVVLGFGSSYDLSAESVRESFLRPLFKTLESSGLGRVPNLLWSTRHAPSVLRNPAAGEGNTHSDVLSFNIGMETVLREYGVPVLDTFNMTSQGLMSHDGEDYGLGVSRVKAELLLNYIVELRDKQMW